MANYSKSASEERQVHDASSQEGHAQERFRAHGEESETGYRDRSQRGAREGSESSCAQGSEKDCEEALTERPADISVTGDVVNIERLAPTAADMQRLQVPHGFPVTVFAENLGREAMLKTMQRHVVASGQYVGTF